MRHEQTQSTNRAAFKIREFAAKFGHHATWGYRQVYAGNVTVIDMMGQLMIPAREVDRLLALAKPYDPQTKRTPQKQSSGRAVMSQTSNAQEGSAVVGDLEPTAVAKNTRI